MAKEVIQADVAIIGAGVYGLNVANDLAGLGHSVVLLDSAKDTIANGPSTRNGRWAHLSYHVAAITDPLKAMEVADTVREGVKKIRNVAPEAFRQSVPSYVVFYDEADHDQARKRWDAGNIPYTSVSPSQYRKVNPEANTNDIIFAAEVNDRVIDSRAYYEKLAQSLQKRGGVILTNAILTEGNQSDHNSIVKIDSQKYALNAQQYVVTAGYGAGKLYKLFTDEELGLRYSKSHLLPLKNVMNSSLITFGKRLWASTYGNTSLLELNRSSVEVPNPDFSVIPEKKEELLTASRVLLPNADPLSGEVYTCLTVDIPKKEHCYYSVVAKTLPLNGDIVTFEWPGKMTSAGIVSMSRAAAIHERLAGVSTRLVIPSSVRQKSIKIASYPY